MVLIHAVVCIRNLVQLCECIFSYEVLRLYELKICLQCNNRFYILPFYMLLATRLPMQNTFHKWVFYFSWLAMTKIAFQLINVQSPFLLPSGDTNVFVLPQILFPFSMILYGYDTIFI